MDKPRARLEATCLEYELTFTRDCDCADEFICPEQEGTRKLHEKRGLWIDIKERIYGHS